MNSLQGRTIPLLLQGFQCSDQESYFSSHTGGYGNRCVREGDGLCIKMMNGAYRVQTTQAAGYLVHDIDITEDSWVFDFVARWVLPGAIAEEGFVGGELVPLGSPLLHSHEVTELQLGGLRIGLVGVESLPDSMHPEMYLSTVEGNWVVHCRAVADECARAYVKYRDGHAEPFTGGPVLRRVLLRRTEFAGPFYEFQARPHVELAAGTHLKIGICVL